MRKKIQFFGLILIIGVGIFVFFSSKAVFPQIEDQAGLWRERCKADEVCQKEITIQRRNPRYFGKDLRRCFDPHGGAYHPAYPPNYRGSINSSVMWTPLGPQGGRVNSITMHPSDTQVLYASFHWGGFPAPIYKTTNGGANWEEIGAVDHYWVTCLAVDPSNPDTIYAGTYGYLFKSTDGGKSWSSSQIMDLYISIYRLMVNKNESSIIYGGGDYYAAGGWKEVFFVTTDGGANWNMHEFPTSNPGVYYFEDLAMDTAYNNLFFSYTNSYNVFFSYGSDSYDTNIIVPHLYKSTDGGATWLDTNYASSISFCERVYSVAFDPANSNQVYAATFKGLYESTDGGANWERTNDSLTETTYKVLVDSNDPDRIWCGGWKEIYRSTDGGGSWSFLGEGEGLYGESYLHLLVSHSFPSDIYAGNYSGIFKTTDQGDNWNPSNNGIYLAQVSQVVVNPSALYVWLDGDACYRSSDGGVSFEWRGHPSTCSYANDLVVNPHNPEVLFAAGG